MKLHFDPNLDFQLQAIEAVCDLFRGQEVSRTEFTVTEEALGLQLPLDEATAALGVGNRLTRLDDEILKNLREVQLRNGIAPSENLVSGDFTVEMETGTGKTYVYIRTIFELNKRYGFTKFVIVVPSVAIKEGVYKTLEITEDHFRTLYANEPFEYFLYDSSRMGEVRNFATSPHIQIMVVTVGAINKKDVNNLYQDSEKTGGEKPIDLIRATRPVLIVDEPQSVDGGLSTGRKGRGKEALEAMNPLATLRYSATHVDKHHMVYRLDAVDAYERKLVKQIEVASATVEDAFNHPYVRLESVRNLRGDISARVEVNVPGASGPRRESKAVYHGDDLEQVTDSALYKDFTIGQISVREGDEFMELRVPGDEKWLREGEVYGDVDQMAVQREMIRRSIREHLDKEKRLRPRGIKVLTLFFVDRVEHYRQYDEEGKPVKGPFARIFEEEYRRLANHPHYRTLLEEVDLSAEVEEVHNGYFAVDKKKNWTELDLTAEGRLRNQRSREAAERAYSLIMREKEKLLSLDEPLKFIFSHSALREGWDNPNVFQICTLRDIQTERERRQTIGRGLRLCVNQEGHRVHGFEVNTLTVVAREGYKEFAEKLQKEIERETGIRFGVVTRHEFAGVTVTDEEGEARPLGKDGSERLWEHLRAREYVDGKGRVTDALRGALKSKALELPEELTSQRPQVEAILRKLAGRLEVKNADERRQVPVRRQVLLSEDFRKLWDRIKHRTTYRVNFDNDALIETCTKALQNAPPIPRTRLQWRRADLQIGKAGVSAKETGGAETIALREEDIELPDLLTELQDKTQLTRRSIYRIVSGSRRLDDFGRNPQQFVELAAAAIARSKQAALVDGIKYQRIGDGDYYAQELFEEEELTGYLKNMLEDTEKSVFEAVVYDSDTEREFAEEMERTDAVKVYAKLPGWFTVPTPLGTYNPDWAVVVSGSDGTDRLYFVVETKSSLYADDLRAKEEGKIECGKAHFQALMVKESPARYKVARRLEDVMAEVR
ncbi:MAG: DEAD/DEAH box helicase family protein [Gemmatimonadota bacterium]